MGSSSSSPEYNQVPQTQNEGQTPSVSSSQNSSQQPSFWSKLGFEKSNGNASRTAGKRKREYKKQTKSQSKKR